MRARLAVVAGLAPLMLVSACADRPAEQVLSFDRGNMVATIGGIEFAVVDVSLPLRWDLTFRRQNGRAAISFDFARPPDAAGDAVAYAIFTKRLGNAYVVTLNGVQLAAYGDLTAHYEPRAWKLPVRIAVPASLLMEQNRLVVELRGDYFRRAGLSAVSFGPARAIDPIYAEAYALRVIVPLACGLLSVLVSAFCCLLWLQQRDSLYAWASIGEAVWSLVIFDTIWPLAPIPWEQWVFITICLRAVWIWCLYIILERVCGQHPANERRAMKIVTFAGPLLVVLGVVSSSAAPYELWRVAMFLFFLYILLRVTFYRASRRTSERILLLVAVDILILTGIHDGLSERGMAVFFGESEWSKYAGSLLALTIIWIVSKRFREARREAAELQATLAARVDARERELRDTYARMSELERSRAVTAERERILRDMHDGVGANLATAMRQLESGSAPAAAVSATLRESLDHLKLSIDAMNLPVGDVTSLLASLRYRLQPRIESAGLRLEWRVEALPPWSAATDQSMRNLQFLLLEAISNALQHANAGTLTLNAFGKDEIIEIGLRDDGQGIGEMLGRGLQSMRARADAIGAELVIEPAAPGTRVRVRLPRERAPR